MKISGNSETGSTVQAPKAPEQGQEDAQIKRIKKQIENAQKQLQSLNENDQMDLDEKMKKRQELNKQITELNLQLRQRQIELRREEQEKRAAEAETPDGTQAAPKKAPKGHSAPAGLSEAGMKAMISAEGATEQAAVYDRVAGSLEGRAAVLRGEIKQDGGHGLSSARKQSEVASLTQKAAVAEGAQGSAFAGAARELQEAAEQKDDEKDVKEQDAQKTEEEAQQAGNNTVYTPIDVKL